MSKRNNKNAERSITHPRTHEVRNISEWAQYVGITEGAMRRRLQNYPITVALKKGKIQVCKRKTSSENQAKFIPSGQFNWPAPDNLSDG